MPPATAAALSVTVPVAPEPPVMAEAENVTPLTHGATTTLSAVLEPPHAPTAEMVAAEGKSAGLVSTVNPADIRPAGTITFELACTKGLSLSRFTTTPPDGAASVNWTVPFTLVPPTAPGAERATPFTQGAPSSNTAVRTSPFRV